MTSGGRRLIFLGLAGTDVDCAEMIDRSRIFDCMLKFNAIEAAGPLAARIPHRKSCRSLADLDPSNPSGAVRLCRSSDLRAASERCLQVFLRGQAQKISAQRSDEAADIRANAG